MQDIPESTETKIAVINTNIGFIQKDIGDIKTSISLLANVYATSKDLQDVAVRVEDRLARLEKSSNLWKWLSPTLSAIVASFLVGVFEYLFLFYFQHLK